MNNPAVDAEMMGRLRGACDAYGIGAYAEEIARLARPGVQIRTARVARDGDIPHGYSKFGGDPDVPEGFVWPWFKGHPLVFIAQIRVEDVRGLVGADADLLPESGLLSFFYDALAQPWGIYPEDAGCTRIVLTPPGVRLVRIWPPGFDLESQEGLCGELAFKPCRLEFTPVVTWPGSETIAVQRLGVPHHKYYSAIDTIGGRTVGHQLLGHAGEVQGPMQTQCAERFAGLGAAPMRNPFVPSPTPPPPEPADTAARRAEAVGKAESWRLLLQVDSDENLGAMWGDVGMIYFWVREPSLRDRTFREQWTVLQCG